MCGCEGEGFNWFAIALKCSLDRGPNVRLLKDRRQDACGSITIKQANPVVQEGGVDPHGLIDTKTDEPRPTMG